MYMGRCSGWYNVQVVPPSRPMQIKLTRDGAVKENGGWGTTTETPAHKSFLLLWTHNCLFPPKTSHLFNFN